MVASFAALLTARLSLAQDIQPEPPPAPSAPSTSTPPSTPTPIPAPTSAPTPSSTPNGAATSEPAPLPIDADEPARRTVVVFDFDEPDNPDPVPPHWQRAQDNPAGGFVRPGFPAHNLAILDHQVKRSGIASVKLPTLGGSASLRLETGQVPVFADADYVVTAWVRTTELKRARAFLVARLLDQHHATIPLSETRSAPIVSQDLWTPISLTIPGKFDAAAWLQIDLELLQPRQFLPEPVGPIAQHTIWREDVAGAAWFDDVGVFQIPRAKVATNAPNNIITFPQKPVLTMLVRDLAGQPLSATVNITDLDDHVVATHTIMLDPGARPAAWEPALPAFGWYRATMDVAAEKTPVSRTEVRFLYQGAGLARHGSPILGEVGPDWPRFGIVAEDVPEELLAELPGVVAQSGTGFVMLQAFDPRAPLDKIVALTRARAPVYESLLEQRQQITLSFGRVPRDLARPMTIDHDDVLAMAERDPALWMPYLSPTLDEYGQRLQRYQLGGVGDEHAMRRDASRGLSAFERGIARLVPAPILTLPWNVDHAPGRVARVAADASEMPAAADTSGKDQPFPNLAAGAGTPAGSLVDAVTLTYPAGFPAEGMNSIAMEWKNAAFDGAFAKTPVEVTIVPDLPSSERFGRRAGVIELFKRSVYFWIAFGGEAASSAGTAGSDHPARIALRSPWHFEKDPFSESADTSVTLWPEPELGLMRVLAQRLGGRRVVGPMPAPPGVKAFILAGSDPTRKTLDRGCVIAWNESALPDQAHIELAAAGEELTVVDAFGNERKLGMAQSAATSRISAGPLFSVTVDTTPVFIEGVDSYLALFASSLKLEPSFIPAVVAEHEHRLTLTNPWPLRITGQLQLKEAVTDGSQGREWNISPRGLMEFVAAPGETVSIPITMSFGPGQLAGPKDFFVLAKVLADRQYPALRLKTTVEVGLPTLDLRPEVQLGPGPDGPDVYVVAAITNHDTKARTLRLETAARGLAGQQLQMSDLPPGQTLYRRFVFKNAAAKLSGSRIVISLSDTEAAERLNKAVMVP